MERNITIYFLIIISLIPLVSASSWIVNRTPQNASVYLQNVFNLTLNFTYLDDDCIINCAKTDLYGIHENYTDKGICYHGIGDICRNYDLADGGTQELCLEHGCNWVLPFANCINFANPNGKQCWEHSYLNNETRCTDLSPASGGFGHGCSAWIPALTVYGLLEPAIVNNNTEKSYNWTTQGYIPDEDILVRYKFDNNSYYDQKQNIFFDYPDNRSYGNFTGTGYYIFYSSDYSLSLLGGVITGIAPGDRIEIPDTELKNKAFPKNGTIILRSYFGAITRNISLFQKIDTSTPLPNDGMYLYVFDDKTIGVAEPDAITGNPDIFLQTTNTLNEYYMDTLIFRNEQYNTTHGNTTLYINCQKDINGLVEYSSSVDSNTNYLFVDYTNPDEFIYIDRVLTDEEIETFCFNPIGYNDWWINITDLNGTDHNTSIETWKVNITLGIDPCDTALATYTWNNIVCIYTQSLDFTGNNFSIFNNSNVTFLRNTTNIGQGSIIADIKNNGLRFIEGFSIT